MMESPFTFPDGDHFPIYLSETAAGGVKLSDRGHTLMHVSYEHDVDLFYEGARASLREQIVRESGIEEDEGIFSIETPPDQVAGALFRFGQALTKIHDLTFLSRERIASTFYEDLRGLVFTILDEEIVETDYIPPDVPRRQPLSGRLPLRREGREVGVPVRNSRPRQGAAYDNHAVAFSASPRALRVGHRVRRSAGDTETRPCAANQCRRNCGRLARGGRRSAPKDRSPCRVNACR